MNETRAEAGRAAPSGATNSKEWVTPALRRLPIAATSGGGTMNEGVGKGKGMAGPLPVS